MAARNEYGEPDPRLPREDEVFEVGAVLYPQDPRFRTDMQNFPSGPSGRVTGEGLRGAQQNGTAAPAAAAPVAPTGPAGPAGGALEAPGAGAQAEVEAAPAAAPVKLTTASMNAMASAVDQAATPEDAGRAIKAAADQAGIPMEDLPQWLLKTLATRFQEKPSGARRKLGVRGEGSLGMEAGNVEGTKPGVLFQEPPAFQDGPIGYSAKIEETPETTGGPIDQALAASKARRDVAAQKERSEAALSPEQRRRRGMPPAEPKTWKRMNPDEQANARKALKEAVERTARYDFHGALAPTLRSLGIDLGSLPKKEAQALREALRKKRAEAREKA
jgi:hypothetical protein